MEKAKKAEVVEDLNGIFAKAGSVVVAHYSGMTVAQMSDLRARMGAAGASFRVSKNRLAVRALKGTPIEGIAHLFKGPTGIAVSDDPVAASKVAVASGGLTEIVRETLQFLGMRVGPKEKIKFLVGSDQVKHGKPNPELFLRAAELLGVDPKRCLVFEDAEPGFVAAKAAGMDYIDVRPYRANIPAAAKY